MNKVNISITTAGLFIAGVLVFLVFKGVLPKERLMVQWSEVESASQAGTKIGRFFFPILKEKGDILLVGEGSFPEGFFKSFQRESKNNTPEVKVSLNAEYGNPSFILEFVSIDDKKWDGKCSRSFQEACVWKKALLKFNKKNREDHSLWISVYRLTERKAIFFYKIKN